MLLEFVGCGARLIRPFADSAPRSVSVLCVMLSTACSSGMHLDAVAAPDGEAPRPADSGATGAGHLYVTMMGANEAIEIDESTWTVVDHIAIGQSPAILLATPDKSKLFSANWSDNTLSSIDVKTHTVQSIALDGRPWVEAMSPDGKYVYAGLGSNKIAVIDVATDSVARSIPVPFLPGSVIVSPDSATLYVANVSASTLQAISAATGATVHDPIGVGTSPAWITISPDGSTVYTLNFTSGDVTLVETSSWKVTGTVSTGSGSSGIVGNTTPDGSLLCVTDYGTADVSAVDPNAMQVRWKIPTDGRPVAIAFRADGSRGYFSDYGHDSLSVPVSALVNALASGMVLQVTGMGRITPFDPRTGMPIGTPMMVGPGPSSIVVIE